MCNEKDGIISMGPFIITPLEQTIFYYENEIILTNREFQVLCLLLKNRGRVYSKKQIYYQVTESEERDDYHTVEITISRIRRKLKQYRPEEEYIITIRGSGYKIKK